MALEITGDAGQELLSLSGRSEVEALLTREHRAVFMLCLGFFRNPTQAEDLTQETLLRAWRLWEQAPVDHFRPWLLRMARNICLDQLRRDKVRRLFLPFLAEPEREVPSPEHQMVCSEDGARLRRVIDGLPQKLREVLVLREYADLGYREIAELLGLSQGTVMSRLSRARARVLASFEGENHV